MIIKHNERNYFQSFNGSHDDDRLTDVRVQRGERIGSYLGTSVGDGPQESGLAGLFIRKE